MATPFDRTAASLDLLVAEARPRLEALGITVADTSNRSGWDWVAGPPAWSCSFARTMTLLPYTLRTVALVRHVAGSGDDGPETWEATWRAEAWQGVNPRFHAAQGSAAISRATLTYGAFERLVLALLRRAGPAFPEAVTDLAWPPFPDLPAIPAEVDHLHEVKTFHREMIEPWTGPPVGCSAAEVDALEAALGWRLPLAYKQYLRFMGADRDGVFVGSDWFIDSASVNTMVNELAHMEVDCTPPGDTLEFMSHQGYIHGWFDLPAASDDPPVHFYTESAKDNRVVDYVRFTDLLMAELRHMSYFTRRVRDRKFPAGP